MKMTVQDVASFFSVSDKTVYRWISQGDLPAYRINDQYRFNRTELVEWATRKRVNFAPALIEEPESETAPLPTVGDALEAGGIFYRLGGGSKEEVLQEIVRVIRVPENVDPDFLFKLLIARENLGTTAVGEGIALPHARMPLVLHVSKPTISLCFLEKPVEFGALDNKPIYALFAFISPTIRAHLHLLSRLSYLLRDKGFKKILEHQGSRDEILGAIRRLESNLQS
jgi:PTS system nitrogen regulatory IIA component